MTRRRKSSGTKDTIKTTSSAVILRKYLISNFVFKSFNLNVHYLAEQGAFVFVPPTPVDTQTLPIGQSVIDNIVSNLSVCLKKSIQSKNCQFLCMFARFQRPTCHANLKESQAADARSHASASVTNISKMEVVMAPISAKRDSRVCFYGSNLWFIFIF